MKQNEIGDDTLLCLSESLLFLASGVHFGEELSSAAKATHDTGKPRRNTSLKYPLKMLFKPQWRAFEKDFLLLL